MRANTPSLSIFVKHVMHGSCYTFTSAVYSGQLKTTVLTPVAKIVNRITQLSDKTAITVQHCGKNLRSGLRFRDLKSG